jgi:hypothetical protein
VTVRRGRWTPADRVESLYKEVPFEVPAVAPAISVRLRYDRMNAVIDLGLLDPERFRGWSGSNKEGFVVTPRRATPGYVPGALPAGEWHVLLGLHRIPAEGVEFELEIDVGQAEPEPEAPLPPRPEAPPRRDLPAAPGRRWLAGDLHAHTVHSDGFLTVAELACLARERGLDFLAVTDHNTISQHRELATAAARAGILLVPGCELTADGGHANVIGSRSWIDFRRGADDWLADAEAADGLLSINHPLGGDMAWRRPMRTKPPLVEVWHSTWDRLGLETIEWWDGWGGGFPIGGSDFHVAFGREALPGVPTTWLEVEGDDVVDALRAGRIAISAAPDAPVAIRHEGELVVVGGGGTTLVGPDGARRRIASDLIRLPAGSGLYRVVADDGLTLALAP